MSNNEMISVPRELLSTYLGGTDGDWVEAGHELRSLLAKPPAQLQGEPVAWEMDDTAGATGEIMVTNSRAVRDDWIRSELPVCPLYGHPAEQRTPDALKAFANEMISGSFDGGDIQDIAAKHGLLRIESRDEECGEVCACREYGFPAECYRKTDLIANTK